MMDPPALNPTQVARLTPRQRDVYEVWLAHPDWSNAQIGMAVRFPAAHIVRRYKATIRSLAAAN